MRIIKNECCDCATPLYPCLGEACPNRRVLHFYCDECGVDIDIEDELFEVEGKDLCIDCLREKFRKDFE